MVAAGQRCQPGRTCRLDRTAGLADFLHLEQCYWLGYPFDFLLAESGALELAVDQPVGGLGTNDLARCGDLIQPNPHVSRSPASETDPSFASTTAGPVWRPTHASSSS